VETTPTPAFLDDSGDRYLRNIGERSNHMFPVRDMLDNGIVAAGASDSPVTDFNPLIGIHAAVNRMSKKGNVVGGRQRVSLMEAIRLFTWNGAYASFEEDVKGSIEPGKLADLIVLDGRILDTEPERIKDLQVELTMIDGECVYQKQGREVIHS
jgi:predicted amidohydrolase YtcJ